MALEIYLKTDISQKFYSLFEVYRFFFISFSGYIPLSDIPFFYLKKYILFSIYSFRYIKFILFLYLYLDIRLHKNILQHKCTYIFYTSFRIYFLLNRKTYISRFGYIFLNRKYIYPIWGI